MTIYLTDASGTAQGSYIVNLPRGLQGLVGPLQGIQGPSRHWYY